MDEPSLQVPNDCPQTRIPNADKDMGEEEAFLLSTIHLFTIDLVMDSGSVAPETSGERKRNVYTR